MRPFPISDHVNTANPCSFIDSTCIAFSRNHSPRIYSSLDQSSILHLDVWPGLLGKGYIYPLFVISMLLPKSCRRLQNLCSPVLVVTISCSNQSAMINSPSGKIKQLLYNMNTSNKAIPYYYLVGSIL